MKKALAGIALIVIVLSANASAVHNAKPLSFTEPRPACLPGQVLMPIYNAQGVIIGWICVNGPNSQ